MRLERRLWSHLGFLGGRLLAGIALARCLGSCTFALHLLPTTWLDAAEAEIEGVVRGLVGSDEGDMALVVEEDMSDVPQRIATLLLHLLQQVGHRKTDGEGCLVVGHAFGFHDNIGQHAVVMIHESVELEESERRGYLSVTHDGGGYLLIHETT